MLLLPPRRFSRSCLPLCTGAHGRSCTAATHPARLRADGFWTRRQLMFTLSCSSWSLSVPCSAHWGGHTLMGGGGLAAGLTLICCGRHHPSRALTCSLILGSSFCSLSLWGSPVLIPGSCSLAVVLGLPLTRLLLCWCTHMAHIEVFTPFGCGSSSSS